jgi:surface polysaccharide O-acyltransferase-like enzyme
MSNCSNKRRSGSTLYCLCMAMGMVAVYYCILPLLVSTVLKLYAASGCVVLGAILCIPKLRINIHIEKKEELYSKKNERDARIDFIKVVATVLVFTFHFFYPIHFYELPMAGFAMFLKTWIRWASATCVPLFMMITGYLEVYKLPAKTYYSKSVFLAGSYIINAVILFMYLLMRYHTVDIDLIKELINLNLYWYIGMYLGLYLMAPLLNLAWNPLSKNGKLIVLVALAYLSSFCTVSGGWSTSYWSALYPILFYFAGAFLRQYRVVVSS